MCIRDRYCLTIDNTNRIVDVSIGGTDSWYMLGHVYFSEDFSTKFIKILKSEYKNQDTKDHLWEDLYIKHISELDLHIKKYDANKVLEFDSLDELRTFDEHYINNTNSSIIKNICSVLKCQENEITDIACIKSGLTNKSFYFSCNGTKYVYRCLLYTSQRFVLCSLLHYKLV